jgi:Rrf2 family protein
MELIRKRTNYALLALSYLAGSEKGRVTCGEVAKACGLPSKLAQRVLTRLANAGLVEATAGRFGGFTLQAHPRDISLRDVIEVMQGPLVVSKRLSGGDASGRGGAGRLDAEWGALEEDLIGFVSRRTLRELTGGGRARAGR